MSFCKCFDVRLVPLLFFLIVAGCSEGEEGTQEMTETSEELPVRLCQTGDIAIEDLWLTPAAAGGTSGVYGTIRIHSSGTDSLVGILCDASERAVLHDMKAEGERMKMVEMTAPLPLLPDRSIRLAPGGKHGMLMDLSREIAIGDSLEVRFITGKGDTISCTGVVSTFSPGEERYEDKGNPGVTLYSQYCSACHGPDGKGQGEIFPPLAGSDFYKDKKRTIDAIVNGLQGEVTVNGKRYNGIMPPLPDTYSDEAVTSVINYVIWKYGEDSWRTTPEEVSGIRE